MVYVGFPEVGSAYLNSALPRLLLSGQLLTFASGRFGEVTSNPVDGVRRPRVDCSEGKTPGLSDTRARQLLNAPSVCTLKGLRDRAILSTLLFHALRRDELASLRVKDFKQIRSALMSACIKRWLKT